VDGCHYLPLGPRGGGSLKTRRAVWSGVEASRFSEVPSPGRRMR
jgi:hypothetical protein